MDEDGLPIVGAGIDFTTVEPILLKRTLANINNFVIRTVLFLNRFSASCERKLADISERIRRLEVTMALLETKLTSIPGLESVTANADYKAPQSIANAGVATNVETTAAATKPEDNVNRQANVSSPVAVAAEAPSAPEATASQTSTVARDPRYQKYLQLVKVGVPIVAMRGKMVAEGLDPSLLETPDAPVPGGAVVKQSSSDSDSEESSESDFSD